VVIYATAGQYNVILSASNAAGSDTEEKIAYITVLNETTPVADFTANPTSIMAGQRVQFNDISLNSPTSWSWSFPGGTPSSSSIQNPEITYNTAGTYSVTLIASNTCGSNQKVISNYINVTPAPVTYCASTSNIYNFEWIAKVAVGTTANSSPNQPDKGYTDFTGFTFNVTPGKSYTLACTPGFSGTKQNEYWKVWIDYNKDGDFADSGEQVLNANKKTTAVSSNLRVPSTATGTTRMRVAMKRGAAPSYCETFTYGEVEDYTITFGAGPVGDGGIHDALVSEGSMLIYPNPAGSELNIQLNGFGERTQLSVFNVLGVKVLSSIITEPYIRQDISTLKPGIYFIVVNDDGRTASGRFVKQ
jgi:PKD repeat protein